MTTPDPELAYLLRYFPTVSETFIYDELMEIGRRQGLPGLWALDPGPGGPLHPGLDDLVSRCRYVPRAHHPAVIGRSVMDRGARGPRERWRAWGCRSKDFRRGLFLAASCRDDGIRHLHAHFAGEAAEVAWLARETMGIEYSVTIHARDLYCPRPSLDDLLASAQVVVTISEANRDSLLERGLPGLDRRLTVIRQGIHLPPRPPVEPDSRDGAPHILFVGRLVSKKGADVLLRAAAELRQRGQPPTVHIVGDGPERGMLEELSRSLGIDDVVCWHGPLTRDRVYRMMSETADVLALPCRVAADGDRDGIPVVLMEAMARGVPVVSTPVSGIPELIEDSRTGLLVAQDDEVALATSISRLHRDADRRHAIVGEARRFVEVHHDVRVQAEKLLTVLGVFRAG